jgi:hypothetical protein
MFSSVFYEHRRKDERTDGAFVIIKRFAGVPTPLKRPLYEGNSISKLQIQVANYVFELSAGNCHR